jgi:glycine/D-amino acid oxidase-like deaminating enzyme
MQAAEVLIVGGAAVGSAAAYFLAAQPDFQGRITVLEQDFSYEKCATALSAASIRHQFSTPENIRLSQFGSHFLNWTVPSFPRPPFGSPLAAHHVCGMRPLFY